MKKRYAIMNKDGKMLKTGYFTEPEVRMAAKAGLRIFELTNADGRHSMEITQELTGLFDQKRGDAKRP